MQQQTPLTPPEVYAAVAGAVHIDSQERTKCENTLRKWEKDAALGFLDCLLQISAQVALVNEESRILAAVIAKNTVGSSWRKTLGSREWSRVQEEEKASVRRRALDCLLQDPSERVAIQMTLLLANIARFDFPSKWPGLLVELSEAASPASRTPVVGKQRALRALKHIIRALRAKRIVAEAPRGSNGRLSQRDLMPLAERIQEERQQLNQQVEATFKLMKDMWQQNFAALLQNSSDWPERAACANKGLLVIREALLLLPSWEGLEESIRQFLELAHAAATATAIMISADEEAQSGENARLAAGGKAFERLTQCIMAGLDRNPVEFASYLPYFLPLYSSTALLALDAATVHRIRPKRRILLMRFLARALLCPVYQLEWFEMQMAGATKPSQKEEVAAIWPKILEADKALKALQTPPQVGQLVESIVTKYLALTPSELEEWQADPEQHVRSADVEATPDAETPRPCGVALLLCMLSRGEGPTANALVQLASGLQGQPRTPEVVLLQEACYRGLGEAFSQLNKLPGISFPDWYGAELRGLLLAVDEQVESGVHNRALRARAIWLLGICSSELPSNVWCDAVLRVVENLCHPDLVVALTAVSSLVGMLGSLLEESELITETEEVQKQLAEAAEAGDMGANLMLGDSKMAPKSAAERRAVLAAKIDQLEKCAANLLTSVLSLESKLEEIESQVRVLQLISVAIELLGDRAQPFLGIIAESLPQVWASAKQASSNGKETGAVARLHSALMAALTHLVDRLGRLATEHQHIAQILPPLLTHALDLSNPESETLSEDALKLLRVTLSGSTQIPVQMQALLPQVMQILHRGRDNAAAMGVLEAFLLLAANDLSEFLRQSLPGISHAIERSVNSFASAVASAASPIAAANRGPDDRRQSTVPKETIADAMAASSISTLLLQLNVDPNALSPGLRGMAMVVSNKVLPGANSILSMVSSYGSLRTVGSVVEGFLEVLTRVLFNQPQALQELVSKSADNEASFLDRWLVVASKKHLTELLGDPQMSSLGRLRRHMATASLSKLACAHSSRALQDPARMARALALGLRTLAERPAFLEDQKGVDEVVERQAAGADVIRDTILSRRLALARVDVVRQYDTAAAFTEAARAALMYCPQTELLEQLSLVDRDLPGRLQELLGGGGGGAVLSLPQPNGHAVAAVQSPEPMTGAMT